MKILLLAGLVGTFAGCFPSRSAQLACDISADCDEGRTCERGFCVSVDSGDGRMMDDAATADADSFDCKKLSTRLFAGCDIPQPGAAIEVTTGVVVYNTDLGTLSGSATPPSMLIPTGRVISIDKLTIRAGASLRVVGTLPLIIASWSIATIDGRLDASSITAELGNG